MLCGVLVYFQTPMTSNIATDEPISNVNIPYLKIIFR